MIGALTLAGCNRTITLSEPAPTGAAVSVCSAVLANLPATVLDQQRRTVEPGRFAAAWGDPPITLRCGVKKPPGLGPASQCAEVNGVGWFVEPGTGGYLFTTIGRAAYVEVRVPDRYAPEINALIDLADAVQRHDPVRQPCV